MWSQSAIVRRRLASAAISILSGTAGLVAWAESGRAVAVSMHVHFDAATREREWVRRVIQIRYVGVESPAAIGVEPTCPCAQISGLRTTASRESSGTIDGLFIVDEATRESGVTPGILVKISGRTFDVFFPDD